jgi:hypothetical protein
MGLELSLNQHRLLLEALLHRVSSSPIIEELIERTKTEIPDSFVPSARAIAAIHNKLVSLAYPMATFGSNPPYRWVGSVRQGEFVMIGRDRDFLYVRRYGKLWSIERELIHEKLHHEVLAFAFGPTPIFHRRHQAAMVLAQHCHPKPRKEAQCACWIPIAT